MEDKNKMRFCINQESPNKIFLLNEEVSGIGDIFSRELLECDKDEETESITIYFNSLGGNVTDCYSIYSSIQLCTKKVIGWNVGLTASSSAIIFQSCDERYCTPYSLLMYHNPFFSSSDVTVEENPTLMLIKDTLVNMCSEKTGKTTEELDILFNKETWLTSKEAKKMGFCDEVKKVGELNSIKNIIDLNNIKDSQFKISQILNEYNELTSVKMYNNPIISKKIDVKMIDKIKNLLNIENEIEIENSILSLINVKSELDNIKNELDITKTSLVEKESKIEELTNKIESFEVENKAILEQKVELEIKNELEVFVKRNTIKQDSVKNWISLMKNDREQTLQILNELPFSIENKIEDFEEVSEMSFLTEQINKVKNNLKNN